MVRSSEQPDCHPTAVQAYPLGAQTSSMTVWSASPPPPAVPAESATPFRAGMRWLLDAVSSRRYLACLIVLSFVSAGIYLSLGSKHCIAIVSFVPADETPQTGRQISKLLLSFDSVESKRGLALPNSGPNPASISPKPELHSTKNGQLIQLTVAATTPQEAASRADAYARKIVDYAADLQRDEYSALTQHWQDKLQQTSRQLEDAHQRLIAFEQSSGVIDAEKETAFVLQQRLENESKAAALKIEYDSTRPQIESLSTDQPAQNPELDGMREKLNQALAYYTEEHPKVKALKAAIADLEQRSTSKPATVHNPDKNNPAAVGAYLQLVSLHGQQAHLEKQIEGTRALRNELNDKLLAVSSNALLAAKLKSDYESLKGLHDSLNNSYRAAKLSLDNAAPPLRILSAPVVNDVPMTPIIKTAGVNAIGSAGLGFIAAVFLCALSKASDGRIRTEQDLSRASTLTPLGTLGNLNRMSALQKEEWAAKSFALLRAKLKDPWQQGLECGFISATEGEGCSTCIDLLSEAAARQGYRVLILRRMDFAPVNPDSSPEWTVPAENSDRADHGYPILRVCFPGASWPIQRRQEWWASLRQFTARGDAALFVDLPPASDPESLFLAERVSNLVWLFARNSSSIPEIRQHVKTFQSINCRFAGAILNSHSKPRRRAAVPLAAMLAALALSCFTVCGAEVAPVPAPTAPTNSVGFLSLSSPDHLSEWQQRLVLGPGDVLAIGLYEEAEGISHTVTVGPDGRINFRYAQNITAAGVTVDELRDTLEAALAKYIRSPRVVIVPQSYASKQYYILGSVAQPGSFVLDRSITIVEAIARAHGFTSALRQRTTFVAADLPRSFMVRKNADGSFKRVEVDFEALFQRGDLTQNRPLAPGDYLYFAPVEFQDVYVLGEVKSPGPAPLNPDTTSLKAIVARGGFTERAYKNRILVIRGSLNHPTASVINAADILAARAPDVRLQPRDIVYVHRKPWAKAEELLEMAIADFLRAAVITSTGRSVDPLITSPIY